MKYFFTAIFIFISYWGFSQYNKALYDSEQKMKVWCDSLYLRNEFRYVLQDGKKLKYADSLKNEFSQILHTEGAFNFPFDSLTKIGKITSDDSLVRVLTYNIRLKGGKYKYYGFVLKRKNKNDEEAKVFELTDKSDSIPDKQLETLTLNSNQWYGASYYQIASYKDKRQTNYILIGWDGYNSYINRKVVEILFFGKKGKPIFGKNVFQSDQKTVRRLIFNHSIKATMSCQYDSVLNALIFDHLVPSSNIYQGMYEFYGPNGTYDGYFLKKPLWIFKEDIEPKNPRKKNELPSKN